MIFSNVSNLRNFPQRFSSDNPTSYSNYKFKNQKLKLSKKFWANFFAKKIRKFVQTRTLIDRRKMKKKAQPYSRRPGSTRTEYMKTLNRQDVNSCKHQQYSKTADSPILFLPLQIIHTLSTPPHHHFVYSQHLPTLQWIFFLATFMSTNLSLFN